MDGVGYGVFPGPGEKKLPVSLLGDGAKLRNRLTRKGKEIGLQDRVGDVLPWFVLPS